MSAEQNFLIKLIAGKSEIKSVDFDKLDWRYFFETAEKQRVIPIIARNAENLALKLPQEIADELQRRARNISLANLELNWQLLRIAKLFKSNDIEFSAYKGATLSHIAFGDATFRQFGDLDVLIRRKDFPAVKNLLLKNDAKIAWNLSEKQEKAVLKHYYELPFLIGANNIPVEIHWSFMERFFAFEPAIETVFERQQIIKIHETEIPTLSNEDLLILLCVHGAKHFWQRLSWICDVGKLIENTAINWTLVESLAAEINCRRMLKLGLRLAEDLLQIELPDNFSADKDDKIIESLAAQLKNNLFEENILTERERVKIYLQMRENVFGKFVFLKRLFLTKAVDSLFLPMGRPQ